MDKAILLCTVVCVLAVSAYADSNVGAKPSFKAAVAAAESSVKLGYKATVNGADDAAAKAAEEKRKEDEGYAALEEDFPDSSSPERSISRSNSVADPDFGTLYDEKTGEEEKNVEYRKTPVNYNEEASAKKNVTQVQSAPIKKDKKKNDHNIMAMSDDHFEDYKQAALAKRQERAAQKAQSKNDEDLGLNDMFADNEKVQNQAPVMNRPMVPNTAVQEVVSQQEPETFVHSAPVINMPVQPEYGDVQTQISAMEEEAQLFVKKLEAIRNRVAKDAETVAAIKTALRESDKTPAVAVRD